MLFNIFDPRIWILISKNSITRKILTGQLRITRSQLQNSYGIYKPLQNWTQVWYEFIWFYIDFVRLYIVFICFFMRSPFLWSLLLSLFLLPSLSLFWCGGRIFQLSRFFILTFFRTINVPTTTELFTYHIVFLNINVFPYYQRFSRKSDYHRFFQMSRFFWISTFFLIINVFPEITTTTEFFEFTVFLNIIVFPDY